MEVKIESRIGKLNSDSERIYCFLSDCNNFQQFITHDRINDWHSDGDSCGFTIENIGSVDFHIVERRAGELIKFSIENDKAENIFLWIQLKSINPSDTRVKLTAKLDANPMLKMLISKPLKNVLDKIVETLECVCK